MFIRSKRPLAILATAVATAACVVAAPASASAATTHPLLHTVGYAQFRSLLRQQGDFAFIVGNRAQDANFASNERSVEAAAQTAGLAEVYRLNPSGSAAGWLKAVGSSREYLRGAAAAHSYFFIYRRTEPFGAVPDASGQVVAWIDLTTDSAPRTDLTEAIQNSRSAEPNLIGHLSPRDGGSSGCTSAITNPAQHPYYVKVTIDGQTYQDGCDTLPGYDDYACTPIPDVQYDFADNEIFYYDDDGDLLAVAPWTEWSRISSYQTWLAQQQAAASGSGGSGSGGSGSSGSGSSGSGSSGSGSSGSGSSGSGSPGSSGSGNTNTAALLSRGKVSKVSGSVSKAPTSKSAGSYKVTITTPKGKPAATGKVTIHVYKVGSHSQVVSDLLSKSAATFKVGKLAKGTWKVLISWPGNTHYQATSTAGAAIKVTK